ncbi:MAG: hypothetical protein LBC76_08125 [Treponema sp.]|jgi:hypothetical protein|nr:hypothetical protein [Treponema sp.]
MGEITLAILVVTILILTSLIDAKENKERREYDEGSPCPLNNCSDCDREFCRWRYHD